MGCLVILTQLGDYMSRQQTKRQKVVSTMALKTIKPKTGNQKKAFTENDKEQNLLLYGLPGTGKTFMALYFALMDIEDDIFDSVTIVRSTVSSRNMGFLPGSPAEKAASYEKPYIDAVNELYGRGDAYEILKRKNKINFTTTSFLRGITLDRTIVIIDEFQNMDSGELHTILTRLGDDTRLFISGDMGQDDLTSERYSEKSGAPEIIRILKRMKCISFIGFEVDDIVRSGFVRDYIIAKNEIETGKSNNVISLLDK